MCSAVSSGWTARRKWPALLPERPRFIVEAPQNSVGVAWTYAALGVRHILSGVDHLLYILAMLFLVAGWRRILATMTAFTATHSLTLTAAALGWVHVPQPPVEACIALSIVFVAREIIEARHGRPGLTARWPWVVSFTFGLMHGFGFAGALAEVGLPTKAIPDRPAVLQCRRGDRSDRVRDVGVDHGGRRRADSSGTAHLGPMRSRRMRSARWPCSG